MNLTDMDEKPLVSIIVPVYQVKDYIGECVESLLAQTYKNLEILLVDDGSMDGSGELCDEYARKDHRIRVIHQENQGLSAARNIGMNLAKGEFVAFVDSDDAVLPDYIKILYRLVSEYHADIAVGAYVKCPTKDLARVKKELSTANVDKGECKGADISNGKICRQAEQQRKEKEVCLTSAQMLRRWHGKYKEWETVVWNKLYRKSVLAGGEQESAIRFPTGRRHEDVLTSHLLVANAERIVITGKKLYLYRIRPESITDRRIIVKHKDENLRAQRERMAFFRERRYLRAYFNLWAGYVLHWVWFGWMRINGLMEDFRERSRENG